jgi:hypothetical protein
MWGSDGRHGQVGAGPGQPGSARHSGQPGQPGPAGRRQPEPPALPDTLEGPSGDPLRSGTAARFSEAGPDVTADFWRRHAAPHEARHEARRIVREFLGSVPRTEPEAVLAFVNPRGELRTVTRAQLSAAVDRLRPRQRQIVRLGVEERWPRQRVCEYLNHISIKTFERDHLEALDILINM